MSAMTPEREAKLINLDEEIAFCHECISHLMENVGPDHIIMKYHAALCEIRDQEAELARLRADRDRLASGMHWLNEACRKRDEEIARWQALAVEERVQILAGFGQDGIRMPVDDEWRKMARRELGIADREKEER